MKEAQDEAERKSMEAEKPEAPEEDDDEDDDDAEEEDNTVPEVEVIIIFK